MPIFYNNSMKNFNLEGKFIHLTQIMDEESEYAPRRPNHEVDSNQNDKIPLDPLLEGADKSRLYKNFKGTHSFDICFLGNKPPSKTISWTYSSILDKLFVSFNSACPIHFSFSSEPPFGSVIRAMPYFMDPENSQYPVERCLTHQRPGEPTNQGFGYPEHILRCNSVGTEYHRNPEDRLSVVVPFLRVEGSMSLTKYLNFFFTCYSSCVGGMNRRPIVVVFSLEHGNQILGQKVVEVRVCACPGRDRLKGERKHARRPENRQSFNIDTIVTQEEENDIPNENYCNPCDDTSPPPERRARHEEPIEDRVLVSIEFQVQREFANVYQSILDSIKAGAMGQRATVTQVPNDEVIRNNRLNEPQVKQEE